MCCNHPWGGQYVFSPVQSRWVESLRLQKGMACLVIGLHCFQLNSSCCQRVVVCSHSAYMITTWSWVGSCARNQHLTFANSASTSAFVWCACSTWSSIDWSLEQSGLSSVFATPLLLTELCLSGLSSIDDSLVTQICQWEHLVHLDISKCSNVSPLASWEHSEGGM